MDEKKKIWIIQNWTQFLKDQKWRRGGWIYAYCCLVFFSKPSSARRQESRPHQLTPWRGFFAGFFVRVLAGVEVAAGGKNLPPKVVADSGGPVLRPVLLPTHIHLSQDMLHKKAVERSSHRILIFPAFIKLKLFFFSIFSKPSNILKMGNILLYGGWEYF